MNIKIGIAKDLKGWHKKFEETFASLACNEFNISYSIIDLNSKDFFKKINSYDVILWNPGYMGFPLSAHYKEKVYYLEKLMGKLVFPCYDTIWHFESKVAQNLLFENQNINTPTTYVTFDYKNAIEIINNIEYPIILKRSEGAASKNVKLVNNKKWLQNYCERVFCNQIWSENRKKNSKPQMFAKYFAKRWFWSFVIS